MSPWRAAPITLSLRLLSMSSGSSWCGHHITEHPHTEPWGCQSPPAPLPSAGAGPLSDPDSESRPSTAQLSQSPAGLRLLQPCSVNENIIFFLNHNQCQNPTRLQPDFWRALVSQKGLCVTAHSSRPVLGDTSLDSMDLLLLLSPSSQGTSAAGQSQGT